LLLLFFKVFALLSSLHHHPTFRSFPTIKRATHCEISLIDPLPLTNSHTQANPPHYHYE
jgi:hypothetical protein